MQNIFKNNEPYFYVSETILRFLMNYQNFAPMTHTYEKLKL